MGVRVTAIVARTRRDILKFTELIVDGHSFGMLDHVVVPGAVVGRVFGSRSKERFYVMEGSIKCNSGCPSSCGTTGKIESGEKLLVMLSNL